MRVIVCRGGQNRKFFHGFSVGQPNTFTAHHLSTRVHRWHLPGITCALQNLEGILDALFPLTPFTVTGYVRTVPKLVPRGHNRVHPEPVSLKNPRNDKVLIDQGGHRSPQIGIVEGRFPDIEPHVIKCTPVIGEQLDIGARLEILNISRLDAPPKHIDAPLLHGEDGGIGGAVDLENNPVDVRAQYPTAYLLTVTEKELVLLEEQVGPLPPIL